MKNIFLFGIIVLSQTIMSCQIEDIDTQNSVPTSKSARVAHPCENSLNYPEINDIAKSIAVESAYQMGYYHGSSRGLVFQFREISIGRYEYDDYTSGWEIPGSTDGNTFLGKWIESVIGDAEHAGKKLWFIHSSGKKTTAWVGDVGLSVQKSGQDYLNSVGNAPLLVSAYWRGFADGNAKDSYLCRFYYAYPDPSDPTGQSIIKECYLFPSVANLSANEEPW